VTNIQFEQGTVVTPFERRDYGRELMMCQRYYEVISTGWINGFSTSVSVLNLQWRVQKRTAPSTVLTGGVAVGNGISNTITGATGASSTVDVAFMDLSGSVAWVASASYSWRNGSILATSEL
jgi:hypothetical protein